MKKSLMLAMAFALIAGLATAETVYYGWEDQGDYVGYYGNVDLDNTFASTVNVYSGVYSLQVTEGVGGGTPQVFVANIWNLMDGDVVTVGFWRYDDTPAASPSIRIWGHWNDDLPGDPFGYSGSAGGNDDYGLGEGWDYTEHTWTVADGHIGLGIECRLYADEGVTQYIDDLCVTVPDNAFIQLPGFGPVATDESTWGGVKALFR